MTKVLSFKVYVKGLEEKIWRKIEITDLRTLADLAYTILITFDTLAYHLYDIIHGKDKYNSIFYGEPFLENTDFRATEIKLGKINFFKDKKMIMCYDTLASNYFIIEYLGSRELEMGNGKHYPFIVDGYGKGIIDDIPSSKLLDIILDVENGKKVYYTTGYEREYLYDYRKYDIDEDNLFLKARVIEAKNRYENVEI